MNSGLRGQTLRSLPQQYSLGNGFPLVLDFLAKARQFQVPVIEKMTAILTGTMDTTGAGGTTALGADAAKLIDKLQFSDETEQINASGAMLRLLRQAELGSKAVDPADVVNTVNAAYEFRFEFYFRPLDTHATRPQDFDCPLENFLDGGQLNWNTPAAVPTGFGPVNADWKVRWEMEAIDARVRELKTRRRVFEQVVQQQEFEYPSFGQIRHAILASKLLTTGYTSLAAFTTIYSRTLDTPPAWNTNGMRELYRQDLDAVGANDNFLAATPTALPIVVPNRFQKIGRMIQTSTLHLDLQQAAPASGRLLLDLIVDRPPGQSTAQLGYPDPGAMTQAVMKHGYVVGEGSNFPVNGSNLMLSKHLPVRIRPTR